MAAIRLSSGTLTGTLWSTKEIPQPKSNGLFLSFLFDGISCTCIASDPADVLRYLIGTSDGSLFLVNLKKNRVTMISKLPHSVSAVAFHPSRKDLVFCAALQSVFLVNNESCRIEKKASSPHFNSITRIAADASLPTTVVSMSVDTIALWDTNTLTCRRNSRETLDRKTASYHFVDMSLTEREVLTCEATGIVSAWTSTDLSLIKRVAVGGDNNNSYCDAHRTRHYLSALGTCSSYVVVGSAVGQELNFLGRGLEGISCVCLPGSATVRSVSVIDPTLCAVLSTDARVWFVTTAAQYSVVFSLALPFQKPVVAFSTSSASYATAATAQELHMYHLPSAKRNFDRGSGAAAGAAGRSGAPSGTAASSSVLPFVRTNSDAVPDTAPEASESYEAALPRQPVDVDERTSQEWVKANLINQKDAATGTRTLLLSDAVKAVYHEDRAISQQMATSGNSLSTTAAMNRKKKQAVPEGGASSSSSRQQPRTGSSSNNKGDASTSHTANTVSRAANIAARTFLDHESRSVNMEKLRVMLMRYGMYPERYRTLIWRFLLQLPEKKFLAPQYAALTEKGPHPGVATLLEPFPLPKNKQRALLEATLSALAWNSPVLSVVHFIPNLVFPFLQLYGSDTQSAVEVVLSILSNWGREFFTYYPHHPVAILSFLNHTLKAEDVELWHHLEECGLGVDVWGWEVLWPFYTEVLTRNEWLQVMDHAMSNEPIWLFLFHVRWMIQLRDMLLQLHDHSQLVCMFRKATPLNLNTAIQQTYRLRQRCVMGTLAEPYLHFQSFKDYAYPVILECDEAVITSKVRELERIAELQRDATTSKQLVTDIKSRIAQASMLEDAFVGKQRAMVAAKLEASNESWIQQVQLEKERQRLRDIEHETRLLAIQEQLRSAQRLESLQHEMNAASQSSKDADVDRARETVKWDFSDRMSAQEMDRLELNARMKLSTMLRTTSTLADSKDANDNVLACAMQDKAVPAVITESLLPSSLLQQSASSRTSSAQHQQHAPPPPPPPPPAAAAGAPTTASASRSNPTRDGQTMTELPPLPPPSTRSDSSTTKPLSDAPVPQPPGPNNNMGMWGGSNDSRDTSTPRSTTVVTSSNSTCESDPVAYYRRLQEKIEAGVVKAQQDQKVRLDALQSRFARQLGDDEGSSEVTEVAVDETTTTTTASETSSSQQQQQQPKSDKKKRHQQPPLMHDNLDDNNDASADTNQHGQQLTEDACSLLASSAASTSMTRAFLGRQEPAFFDLMHRDPQRK